ncbi:MAG: hypothetical protein AAF849_03960 [Bacteroidota bacterium]
MKEIIYGIFAEDDANEIFIRNSIPQLVAYYGYSEKVEFILHEDFTTLTNATNNEYVKDKFISHASMGMKAFVVPIALCIVALDAEDSEHGELFHEMKQKLNETTIHDRVLISIPVQCVEYWLYYLKLKNENSSLEATDPIEKIKTRREVKKLVYGREKPTNKKSSPIVEKLSKNINIDWLKQCSNSFDHFCRHFEEYIEKISPA